MDSDESIASIRAAKEIRQLIQQRYQEKQYIRLTGHGNCDISVPMRIKNSKFTFKRSQHDNGQLLKKRQPQGLWDPGYLFGSCHMRALKNVQINLSDFCLEYGLIYQWSTKRKFVGQGVAVINDLLKYVSTLLTMYCWTSIIFRSIAVFL